MQVQVDDSDVIDARARFVSEFDMNSGVFIGTVESYTVVDARYRLPFAPQAAVSLTAMNLFDEEQTASFIGAPEIGRLVMLKLPYNLE